jgi:hypothetical protein
MSEFYSFFWVWAPAVMLHTICFGSDPVTGMLFWATLLVGNLVCRVILGAIPDLVAQKEVHMLQISSMSRCQV